MAELRVERLKIVFAGTPAFALPALQALLKSTHQVCAVYTQLDKPAGRGLKLTSSPVKQFAVEHHLPLYQLASFRDPKDREILQSLQPDVLINVACGLLIPQSILDLPRYGCINIHPSLLPRWRGAAPIQRAILADDAVTGVTIMQMDAGLDTGAILKQIEIPIGATTTTADLFGTTAELGAMLLLEVLSGLSVGIIQPVSQTSAGSTYAEKISKAEAELDWTLAAKQLDLIIRAFNPWPVAYTTINNERLRVWSAMPVYISSSAVAGTIVQCSDAGIDVATGDGMLRLTQVQLSGTKILSACELMRGHRNLFVPGRKLERLTV